ncbi:MAG: type 1 glutamine amidotransferase [Verrucomicrobiales bacterium]|jgi:type 1 glutamine amidotransferase
MTKKIFLQLLATLAIAASAVFADDKKLSVLIIDGQNNHKWAQTTPVLKTALESSGRFSVEVSTSPSNKGTKEEWAKWRPVFSKYDVVLSNYNGQDWPEEVRGNFTKYVADGGGLVIVHAANNAFPNWPEYNRMIGIGGWGGRSEKSGPYLYLKDGKLFRDKSPGRGGSHGPQREFEVTTFPGETDHPIMKGLPKSWLHTKDELYDSMRGPAEGIKVLATSFSEKSKKHEPMLMTIDYGKGRVFHSTLGHADYSMNCVGFFTTIQRGTEWAATGKVTIAVPENFPGTDKVVPVEK